MLNELLTAVACAGKLCWCWRAWGRRSHSRWGILPAHWNWGGQCHYAMYWSPSKGWIGKTSWKLCLQVAVAYSALRHLNPGVAKGLGIRIHQTFGFRLWQICERKTGKHNFHVFQIQNDRVQDDEKSDIVRNETTSDPYKRRGAVELGSQMHQISKYLHHCNFKGQLSSTARRDKTIHAKCAKNSYKL